MYMSFGGMLISIRSTKRTPSWTDRILYATYGDSPEMSAVKNLHYTSIPSYTTSDHVRYTPFTHPACMLIVILETCGVPSSTPIAYSYTLRRDTQDISPTDIQAYRRSLCHAQTIRWTCSGSICGNRVVGLYPIRCRLWYLWFI